MHRDMTYISNKWMRLKYCHLRRWVLQIGYSLIIAHCVSLPVFVYDALLPFPVRGLPGLRMYEPLDTTDDGFQDWTI